MLFKLADFDSFFDLKLKGFIGKHLDLNNKGLGVILSDHWLALVVHCDDMMKILIVFKRF